METDYPTVELFFAFRLTFCTLQVYKEQEAFARRVLEAHGVEFLKPEDSNSWQKIDTRVLLDLVAGALVTVIPSLLPADELAKRTAAALGITQ